MIMNNKTLLLFALFFLPCFSDITESVISGNVKRHYKVREYGKVQDKDRSSIIPPFYLSKKKYNFSFSAAYTLFMPYQEGLALASPENSTSGKVFPAFYPKNGFNISISKHLFYDNWSTQLEYTWFYNMSKLRYNTLDPSSQYTSLWIDTEDGDVTEIYSKFENQFNVFFLSLYRYNQFTKTLIFTYKIGLLGAWENSNLAAIFDVTEDSGSTRSEYDLKYKQDWWAAAPRADIEIALNMYPGVLFFVNNSIAMNLAKHFVYQDQTKNQIFPSSTSETTQNLDLYVFDLEPMLGTELGIKGAFPYQEVCFQGKISWQTQTWFNHNKFQSTLGQLLNGNFSLQGLIVNIGIDF